LAFSASKSFNRGDAAPSAQRHERGGAGFPFADTQPATGSGAIARSHQAPRRGSAPGEARDSVEDSPAKFAAASTVEAQNSRVETKALATQKTAGKIG